MFSFSIGYVFLSLVRDNNPVQSGSARASGRSALAAEAWRGDARGPLLSGGKYRLSRANDLPADGSRHLCSICDRPAQSHEPVAHFESHSPNQYVFSFSPTEYMWCVSALKRR
jgi:hypothetical protein